MIDRLVSGATCALGLGMFYGAWQQPAASWPFWCAVAVVAINLGRLIFPARRPGYRPEGSGGEPPERVERQPSSVRPPRRPF